MVLVGAALRPLCLIEPSSFLVCRGFHQMIQVSWGKILSTQISLFDSHTHDLFACLSSRDEGIPSSASLEHSYGQVSEFRSHIGTFPAGCLDQRAEPIQRYLS